MTTTDTGTRTGTPTGTRTGTPTGADAPSVETIEAYAAALRRSVVRALGVRVPPGGFGVDDIAQEVVLAFLENPVRIMATYREPWIYARASVASRIVDLGRRERAQRGEGSRLVETHDGRAPRRVVVCLDATGNAVDLEAELAELARGVDEIVLDRLTVDELLAVLTPTERWLLERVEGGLYTVTEIAAVLGLARETVSRRLSTVRRQLHERVTA
jgi:RNA polymerase sigma factor (sigma-70 family)